MTPTSQAISPSSPYHDANLKTSRPDVPKARALLKAAGYPNLTIELTYGDNAAANQLAQMLQAMMAEAGITLKLLPSDYATALSTARNSNFEMLYSIWSGRSDPDANLNAYVSCKGVLNIVAMQCRGRPAASGRARKANSCRAQAPIRPSSDDYRGR